MEEDDEWPSEVLTRLSSDQVKGLAFLCARGCLPKDYVGTAQRVSWYMTAVGCVDGTDPPKAVLFSQVMWSRLQVLMSPTKDPSTDDP